MAKEAAEHTGSGGGAATLHTATTGPARRLHNRRLA
jgi:hypothetical protein